MPRRWPGGGWLGWLAGRINWNTHLTFLKNQKQVIQDKSSAKGEMNDRDLEV